MSAVGLTLWRTISLEFLVSSLSRRRTISTELGPLRRMLQPHPPWLRCSQSWSDGIRPKIHLASFATASKWRAKVPLEPEQVPKLPRHTASRPYEIKRVSPALMKHIFGREVGLEKGNLILQLLQVQRVAGILDEGIPDIDESTLNQGLEYLRTKYPLDEDAAIISRLEREEAQQSQDLVDRAVKIGLYAPLDPKEQPSSQVQTSPKNALAYVPQQDPDRNRVLGYSYIEQMRKENKAILEKEEAAKKAEQEAAEAEAIRTGVPIPTAETQALVRREKLAEKKSAWMEYSRSAFGKEGEGWPTMTVFQRLWPSGLFTAAVLGMSALFAIFYVPPPKKARIWPDIPPAAATVLVIIGMNVLVFFAWHVVVLQRGMFRYFLNVPGLPSAFSIIGCTFSHQQMFHLTTNMLVLWIFGSKLHDSIGRGPFLAIYMACGALSSFGSLTGYVIKSAFQSGALGASGAVAGVIAAWCVVNKEYANPLYFSLYFVPLSGQ